MKKSIIIFLLIVISPIQVLAISDSAASSILVDTETCRVLYSKNPNEIRSVASISKIMTAILAVESGKLDKTITINDSVSKAYGSGIYVKVGEKLTLKDLTYGLMLRSGNDAAMAIADYVSGSKEKFVKLMNKKALEIGMKNTTFNNPSGLDEEVEKGNFSTSYDMSLLTCYANKNKKYLDIVGTKKYTLKTNKNTYIWHNKNRLLYSYDYTIGGKTGYTKKAKRTLVTTAKKDGLSLTVVTLNDGNDFLDHKNLHEYGFNTFNKYTLLDKEGFKVPDEDYYKRNILYIDENFTVALTDAEKDSVKLKYEIEKKRNIKTGDKVGEVKAMIDDEEIASTDIKYKDKLLEKNSSEKRGFINWLRSLW